MTERIREIIGSAELYVYSSLIAGLVVLFCAFIGFPAYNPADPWQMVRWCFVKAGAVLAGMIAMGGVYYFFDRMSDGELIARIKTDAKASAYLFCTFIAVIGFIVGYAG